MIMPTRGWWCGNPALAAAVLAATILGATDARAQDFGDHSSATLTGKAWKALREEQSALALAYTGKCRELYFDEALKQQRSLEDFAPADKAHDLWAVNDVGTCLYIEGQVHEKEGRTQDAIKAYRSLADQLRFSQCWDPKGWFWRPAETAAMRIKLLEFDAKLE